MSYTFGIESDLTFLLEVEDFLRSSDFSRIFKILS